jgi:hypothetical protein
MFYLKVSFHVFNYKDKHNRNRPPPNINLVPKRLNVQDRLITFRLFRVMTSEMLCRLLPVVTLLLRQRQYIIVVDAVGYK